MADLDTPAASRNFGLAQSTLLALYAASYFLDRTRPLLGDAPAWGAAGSALCLAGLVLLVAAIVALRQVVQVAPEPRPGGHLVTSGVYAWLRHPIYTAILIVVAGLFLKRPTPLVACSSVLVIAFLLVKVRYEERLLGERYPGYADYTRRAWGIIPGFGRRGD